MFRALLFKDYLLLRTYLRVSLLTSILLYPVGFGLAYWFSMSFLDEGRRQLSFIVLATLADGSVYGLILTCLCAAFISASTIALERSDRSSEFLACLPPTRWQNLMSKLLVMIVAIGGMVILHNMATWIAWNLTAYARTPFLEISFMRNVCMSCVVLSITGFSFAGSSCMKSNGGPALAGLMSPLLSLSIVFGLGKLIGISYEGNMFAIQYALTCVTLGIAMLSCGSVWYLGRKEP